MVEEGGLGGLFGLYLVLREGKRVWLGIYCRRCL